MIFDMYKGLYRTFNDLMLLAPVDTNGSNETEDTEDVETTNEKTYTQTQVDTAVSRAKSESIDNVYKNLGFESESDMQEFIDKYKKQEEDNKTELVKEKEKTKKLEAEKVAETEKAKNLQYKFDVIAKGCNVDSVDDVVTLIKAKLSDDKDFETVLQEIKDQYPIMFNAETKNNSTGGGGTVPRKKSNNDISGMGKRLAEQRKQNNSIASNNNYFN